MTWGIWAVPDAQGHSAKPSASCSIPGSSPRLRFHRRIPRQRLLYQSTTTIRFADSSQMLPATPGASFATQTKEVSKPFNFRWRTLPTGSTRLAIKVMAGEYNLRLTHGFLTDGRGLFSFDYPESDFSGLRAVNNAGQVGGYFVVSGLFQAYLATPRSDE